MQSGYEIRAEIDSALAKSLILVNGGGVIALLAFLPETITNPEFKTLATSIVWALLLLQFGILFGLLHTWLRRRCNLDYEVAEASSPTYPDPWTLRIYRFKHVFREPRNCVLSWFCALLSGVMFFIGGLIVFIGGLCTISGN